MRTFAHFTLGLATVAVTRAGDSVRVEIDGPVPAEHIVVEVAKADLKNGPGVRADPVLGRLRGQAADALASAEDGERRALTARNYDAAKENQNEAAVYRWLIAWIDKETAK